MKKTFRLLIILSVILSFFSCSKEEGFSDKSVIVVENSYKNELDQWIYDNLTLPYNIEVSYKWDDGDVSNEFHVVPPKMEKAKEFLEAYYNVWIKCYEEEAIAGGNPDFLKAFMPKQLVLVGSPQFNGDGTMTLGLAEGGKKVIIFNVDNFAEVNSYPWDSAEKILQDRRDAVVKSFHTIHHEFAHIMHQNKFYADEFKEICKSDYTANWIDVDGYTAEVKGFITPYSMLNDNEDFVEIVAGILTHVKYSNTPHAYNVNLKTSEGEVLQEWGDIEMSEWDTYLYIWAFSYDDDYNVVQTSEAKLGYNKFISKLDIVTSYYKEKWGVDLYSLQKRIDVAVNTLIK